MTLSRRAFQLVGGLAPVLAAMACSSTVEPPVELKAPHPYALAVVRQIGSKIVYPKVALEAGLQGTLVLQVVIGRDGQLAEAQIAKGTADPVLDAAMLRAARTAAPFPPLPADLKASRVRIIAPIEFVIRS
jgi:protein TonB